MRRHTRLISIILMFLLGLGALAGCGAGNNTGASSQAAGHKDFKVGLVTDTGGLDDHSFNHLSYVGLERAKDQLGITVSVVQSQSSSDYVPYLSNYARQGYNLVIAVGFLMEQAVLQVSKQYPNTKFLIIDDSVPGDNVASALFSTQQCGYLVGEMAGLVQKEHALPHINDANTLGVIGGISIPPVNTYIAGFEAGVKQVDPTAKILVKYTNDFNNPNDGATFAQAMIAQKADIIFQVAGGTGFGVISAAKAAGIYAIGVDADQNYLAPDTVITSAEKKVDVCVFDTIKNTLDGHFKAGQNIYDLSSDGVGYASPIAAIPSSIAAQVQQAAQEIKEGKITPPSNL